MELHGSLMQHNGSGPGQTWALAIIQNSNEILSQNIQLEFRWVPSHAGIAGKRQINTPSVQQCRKMKRSFHHMQIGVNHLVI
jgi:hypothetical protein